MKLQTKELKFINGKLHQKHLIVSGESWDLVPSTNVQRDEDARLKNLLDVMASTSEGTKVFKIVSDFLNLQNDSGSTYQTGMAHYGVGSVSINLYGGADVSISTANGSAEGKIEEVRTVVRAMESGKELHVASGLLFGEGSLVYSFMEEVKQS